MALPSVNGWIIDFRSARAAFDGRLNISISALTQACADRKVHYCHCEHEDFKAHASLKLPFIDDQDCRIRPTDDVMAHALALRASINSGTKEVLIGDKASIFILASALAHQFGIITDGPSGKFLNVISLARKFGVAHVTTAQFAVSYP